jgi:Uma2 family endonuclease
MGKLLGRAAVEYPESDGKPMAETDIHRDVMLDLIERLKARYADRDDVYVSGNLLVYYAEGKPKVCLAPDCFVAFGVPNRRRRTFKTWEEGVFPSVVIEVTSRKTKTEDTGKKFRAYQDAWKVRELFLFDPTGDYLDTELVGYRLTRGVYKPIRPSRGRLPCAELGLTLEVDETRLVLRDEGSGEELLRAGDEALRRERQARERAETRLAAVEARLAEVERRLHGHTPPAT